MSETLTARVVKIFLEEGKTGLFYATSPDLKGLVVARPSPQALELAIPLAIREMYAACGEDVVVSKLAHDECVEDNSWVAFPANIARAMLEVASAGSA
jgi:hypothetical protein